MDRNEIALRIFCAYIAGLAAMDYLIDEVDVNQAFKLADTFMTVAHQTSHRSSVAKSATLLDLGEVTGSERGSL